MLRWLGTRWRVGVGQFCWESHGLACYCPFLGLDWFVLRTDACVQHRANPTSAHPDPTPPDPNRQTPSRPTTTAPCSSSHRSPPPPPSRCAAATRSSRRAWLRWRARFRRCAPSCGSGAAALTAAAVLARHRQGRSPVAAARRRRCSGASSLAAARAWRCLRGRRSRAAARRRRRRCAFLPARAVAFRSARQPQLGRR